MNPHQPSVSSDSEVLRKALERDKIKVEKLFSTKPVTVSLGPRRFVVPANYFGPMQGSEPDSFDAGEDGYFGFFLFRPEYGGFTKENWIDSFDRRRISVVEISAPNPKKRQEHATRIGSSRARFEASRWRWESIPTHKAFGLVGYRPKGGTVDIAWTGTRSNGEFIYFTCNLAPGDSAQVGILNPLCDVRYYSEKEDLFVLYRYANDQLPNWREIDDAIWEKLREWRVKYEPAKPGRTSAMY